MSIKAGMKMLYYKTPGDKKSEEVVEIVSVQSEAEGGGVTIYIPSLKRERDTEISRLTPMDFLAILESEHKERLAKSIEDKPRRRRNLLKNWTTGIDKQLAGILQDIVDALVEVQTRCDVIESDILLQTTLENYETDVIGPIKQRTREAEISGLRTMNTRLLLNQQEMVKEMKQMKAELLELRNARSIPEAVVVQSNQFKSVRRLRPKPTCEIGNPLIGTKI